LRLLRLSRRIGLGESARFLTRHGSWVRRLTLPRQYRPSGLVERLAPFLGIPENRIAGLHLFTFNEIAQEEAWRQEEIMRVSERAAAGGS
jgi:methylenetetrahydrofolate reductase (NADPH)